MSDHEHSHGCGHEHGSHHSHGGGSGSHEPMKPLTKNLLIGTAVLAGVGLLGWAWQRYNAAQTEQAAAPSR